MIDFTTKVVTVTDLFPIGIDYISDTSPTIILPLGIQSKRAGRTGLDIGMTVIDDVAHIVVLELLNAGSVLLQNHPSGSSTVTHVARFVGYIVSVVVRVEHIDGTIVLVVEVNVSSAVLCLSDEVPAGS